MRYARAHGKSGGSATRLCGVGSTPVRGCEVAEAGRERSRGCATGGVHRQSVNRWAKQLATSGRAGLKHGGRVGRPPRLATADRRRVEQALKRGPEALGYATGLWTAGRVAALIEQECGVQYHPGHVWRLLKQLGWSCQRPTGRARERDDVAIREWTRRRWPALKKTRRASGKRSSS